MSHEFESGFFVKTPAWHNLGVVLENAPTIAEGIKAAGLDWGVEMRPIYTPNRMGWFGVDGEELQHDQSEGGFSLIDSHRSVVRTDNQKVLGVVGSRYEPYQNAEAFEFFDPFLSDGQATLETAGSLMEGKRIFVLAKLNEQPVEVVNGDNVLQYLLLYTSHDGSVGVGIMYTPIRVVCWNTLSASVRYGEGKKSIITVKHARNMRNAIKLVQGAIDTGRRTFEFTLDAYRKMTTYQMPIGGFRRYVRNIWEVPELEEKMPRAWDKLTTLFETGMGTEIQGVRGTLWGGFNAVTEFVQHVRGRSDESRLDGAWFGPGKVLREKALDVAMEMVA